MITRFSIRDIRRSLCEFLGEDNRYIHNLYTLLTIQGFPIPYNVNTEDIPESDMSIIAVFLEFVTLEFWERQPKEKRVEVQNFMEIYGFSWP